MTVDIANLVGRMLVPAAVISILGLIRKYLPAGARKPGAHPRSKEDIEDFSSANVAVYSSMAVVGIAFALSVHWALVAGNRHFAETDGPAAFQLFPSAAIWWFFPGIGALCLSWPIVLFLWALLEGHGKVARYIQWTNEQAGFDSTRALQWLAVIVALPIGIASLLAIPLHSTLRDTDIVVGHYATLAREIVPYSEARRLLLVDGSRDRNGKFTARAELLVDFRDGARWSSADNRDFMPQVDRGLTEFLQRKTGLPVEHRETEAGLQSPSR
jgi:hypothetical protein